MLHATGRQFLCHSKGCGLATKVTVVWVLIETLPWILSLRLCQALFIKIKMSWLTRTPLSASGVMSVGESLPRPVLHEHPASLYIFPKSWCSVIKHSPSSEQSSSRGHLSKGDWPQPNKSPLKLENFPSALLGTPKPIPQLLMVVTTSLPTAGTQNTASHSGNYPTQLQGADT